MISLSSGTPECGDAQAQGLYTFMTKSKFIYTLLFIYDIIVEMKKLAKIFQLDNFDNAKVNDLLKGSYKYFNTLISYEDKSKSFQEAENTSMSDVMAKERG